MEPVDKPVGDVVADVRLTKEPARISLSVHLNFFCPRFVSIDGCVDAGDGSPPLFSIRTRSRRDSLPFLLRPLATWLCSMLMHASCAAREGWGVLLTGAPGSGKSDLLLRLLDRGFVVGRG